MVQQWDDSIADEAQRSEKERVKERERERGACYDTGVLLSKHGVFQFHKGEMNVPVWPG